jgi:hypothetical protein
MGLLDRFSQAMTNASSPKAPEEIALLLDACVRQACAGLKLADAEIYCGGGLVTMFLTPKHAWEAVIVGADAYQLYPGFVRDDGETIVWPNVWVADNYSMTKFVDALQDALKEAASAATPETVTLYRPVGTKELALIEASGWTAFPPRLPEQPIFYPVTNEEYAHQIARDWNTKHNDDKRGYVTRFSVLTPVANGYERHVVGGREHEELWVPAEELPAFNAAIVGKIEVIAMYQGNGS